MTPSDHAEAVEWASHWSQRWFLAPEGHDRFRVGLLDAGWATHVEAFLILLRLASEQLGASRQPPSLRGWLKQQGMDRGLRAAGLRRRRGKAPRLSTISAIIEIPTPSMADPAAMVIAAAGQDGAVGVTDPRAAVRIEKAPGVQSSPLVLSWGHERRLVRGARPALSAAWRAATTSRVPMPLRETDLGPAALRRLAPLVLRSMPYLAAEEVAVERFLRATRPTAVALASDQHRIGRVAVAVARRLEIATVVLQHGLPQTRIGYLPVVADIVAAWSPASRQWFLDAGAPAGSVVVTGNPRADALREVSTPLDGRRHVLLALSPTATETNAALVGLVLDAMTELGAGALTIKLHPGQGDWSFVTKLVNQHAAASRVVIRRHEALGPLLDAASAVVVHRSSVAADALAAGRPVVVGRAGTEATTADLELAALDLPVCESPAELARAIDALSEPEAARTYFAQRDERIREHTGPISGSVGRILALMRDAGLP